MRFSVRRSSPERQTEEGRSGGTSGLPDRRVHVPAVEHGPGDQLGGFGRVVHAVAGVEKTIRRTFGFVEFCSFPEEIVEGDQQSSGLLGGQTSGCDVGETGAVFRKRRAFILPGEGVDAEFCDAVQTTDVNHPFEIVAQSLPGDPGLLRPAAVTVDGVVGSEL